MDNVVPVKTHLPIDRKSFEDYLSFDLPSLTWNDKCYQCLLYLSMFPENGSGLTSYNEEVLVMCELPSD